MHWHTCPPCQQKWSHETGNSDAHRCPTCRGEHYERFNTEASADDSMRPPNYLKDDPNGEIPTGRVGGLIIVGFVALQGTGPDELRVKFFQHTESRWSWASEWPYRKVLEFLNGQRA